MRKLTLATALACTVFATLNVRAQVPDTNHTVVRFEVLTSGTNYGSFDVELFDQEKPETVKNFLLYVYSGAYSNLVLHRLIPNFVVQAGHIRVDVPNSTSVFSNYPASTNFGRITNEYAVGPQLTNEFGTIAMARISGQTNSATTDWFINLTNNAFLDNVDGGFTVFGRVVNTSGDRSGTNLLNHFNGFSNGNGIRNYFVSGESLSDLPVATNRPGSPLYADLFTVRASVVQGGMPYDGVAPTIAITDPTGAVFVTTNSSITVTGTATDDQEVARVLYDTSSGQGLVASGTTNWTLELSLVYGTNRVAVRSVDAFGNISPVIERLIVRQERPPAPNHTVVRFDIFTSGTNFGKLDIELYDQEKPETVRNFLMYVYSGAYSNLALHELIPGRILQAGHVQVKNMNPELDFVTYDVGPNFGLIPNEYGIGPQIPNEFGTIATARMTNHANTTSNEWHINLGNNTSFDTNFAGSTVFGRVVNSENERSGIYLLNYFNSLRGAPGGTNIRSFSLQFENFDMPVTAYSIFRLPKRKEMYFVNASIIQAGLPRDTIAPIVQINDPAETGIIIATNSTISLSGTAVDNQELARVIYDAPAGVAQWANGKENWTAEVSLVPGTNDITVRGIDYFGNVGTARRIVLSSAPRRVSFQINGKGKVTGIVDGQELLVGLNYTFLAQPARRQFFIGWRDQNSNFLSTARSFTFTMQEGLTNITAVFSRTLLGISNGVYKGLFFAGTNGPSQSAGTISLNVAPNGAYSGRLAPIGASYTIRGKFDTNGGTTITGQRGTDLLVLRLSFYSTETIFGDYFDSHSFSSVGLWHVQKFSAETPSSQAGTYSFLISPTLDTQNAVVRGYGFGYATVDSLGRIRMKGTLGDSTEISQKSALLAGDTWPFYASAKSGREVVLGSTSFSSNHMFAASLHWFSPDFPGKTNQNARLDGSLFVPPSEGAPLFNWTNGVISLSGGGLPAAIFANVQLNPDGSFTIPSNPNNIQIGAPDANGTVFGSFTHPVTTLVMPLQGAVLQSSNITAGFFPASPGNGAFLIRAQ